MQQIVSITNARNNLSQLVEKVAAQKQEIVIVRDSEPEAVLIPYTKVLKDDQKEQKFWKLQWRKFLKEARKAGKRWAKKNNIDLKKISEEELYDLIAAV